MQMIVDQKWVVPQAPHQRGFKLDEFVVRLIKNVKSLFLMNLKLSIDGLVVCQKLTPVSHFQVECLADLYFRPQLFKGWITLSTG